MNSESRLDPARELEEMRSHVRAYITVFVALAVLTGMTVWAARWDVSQALAIGIALVIATVKGSLVACYFMHLISERKLIYGVLILTVIFFAAMMALPMGQWGDSGTARHVP